MIKVRNMWIPNIDYNKLALMVLQRLTFKSSRLTGNEIHFIRLHFEMTLQKFAKRFCVSHPAVVKWEKRQNKATQMNWSTEKDIRLFVLSKLKTKPALMIKLYDDLTEMKNRHSKPIQLEVNMPLAA